MDVVVIVAIVLLVDGVVVYAVTAAVASAWNTMAARFPGAEPRDGAVRRDFQSFAMGVFNLGWCVHVAVDEERLHLMPARLMRMGGARAVSVPWDEVGYLRSTRRGKRAHVRIGRQELVGPAWALDLAKRGNS